MSTKTQKTFDRITALANERWAKSPRVQKYEERRLARWSNRDKLADRAYWVRIMREEGDLEPVSAAFYPTHGGHGGDLMDLCLLSRDSIARREYRRQHAVQLDLFGGLV